jgi:hypothetical protein
LKKTIFILFVLFALVIIVPVLYFQWKANQIYSDFKEDSQYINEIEFDFIANGTCSYNHYVVKDKYDLALLKKTFIGAERLSRTRVGVYATNGRGNVETSTGKIYDFDIDFDSHTDFIFISVSYEGSIYADLQYLDSEHLWLNYVTSHKPTR